MSSEHYAQDYYSVMKINIMRRTYSIAIMLILTVCILSGCRPETIPPALSSSSAQEATAQPVPAPWSVQLKKATEFASRLDPNAFLTQVKAERGLYHQPGDYRSLHVRFRFASSNNVFWITFEDTDVEATIKQRGGSPSDSQDLPSPDQEQFLEKMLAMIQVSPAEALQQTLPTAQAHGLLDPQASADMDMRLRLDRVPPAWSMLYTTSVPDAKVRSLMVEVNASTGEVTRTSSD